jgi:hypothetical protein
MLDGITRSTDSFGMGSDGTEGEQNLTPTQRDYSRVNRPQDTQRSIGDVGHPGMISRPKIGVSPQRLRRVDMPEAARDSLGGHASTDEDARMVMPQHVPS